MGASSPGVASYLYLSKERWGITGVSDTKKAPYLGVRVVASFQEVASSQEEGEYPAPVLAYDRHL